MTPAVQFAKSVKYLARPISVIPYEDTFILFESYGSHRTMIGQFSSAELVEWAKTDFSRQRSRQEEAMRRPARGLDIDIKL